MDPKIGKDIRRFSQISNLALTVITTLAMGVGLGMLLDYLFDTNYWIVITSILFMVSAIVNFIRSVIGLSK